MTMAAVQPSFQAGEWARGLEIARRGQAFVERAGLPPMPAGLPLAMALLLCNERRSARPLLAGAAVWLDEAADPWALGPVLIFGVGQAFMWLEEYERARRLLTAAIEHARELSAPGLLPYGLLVLAELEFRTGHWASALALGAKAVRSARRPGR
jgi:hypothetical protein